MQSFVDLSFIVNPNAIRKRKISLKAWSNWLCSDPPSISEEEMFNENVEYQGWRKKFLKYSSNSEQILLSQVERMKKISSFANALIGERKKCQKSYLISCFKAKNKINETEFITWTEFTRWVNTLGKGKMINHHKKVNILFNKLP
jgi:hypothetical protein